jgi:crotonobetainyl-CoA:carnitine CoA-transferase CaiB-like acyl-CoA transferase
MLSNYSVAVLDGDADISKMGSGHPQLAPFEAVPTKDGHIVIAPGTNRLFRELCRVLELPELTDDERFLSNPRRVRNRRALLGVLEAKFRQHTTAEWLATLEREKIPCAPVNTLRQAYDDPQLTANGMLRQITHPEIGPLSQIGAPYRINDQVLPIRMPPPILGQHTAQVLSELLGMSPAEIAELADAHVISTAEPLSDPA